jgi:tRNA-splicing ligase RtcB
MNSESEPSKNFNLIHVSDAISLLHSPNSDLSPIRVIGNAAIQKTFDQGTLQQALNARSCPGVTDLVINPDAHIGYGAPIGCVMTSDRFIYPGPVGVDIKCSMSLLQTSIPKQIIQEKTVRRAIITAISERIPTGAGRGQNEAKKSRKVSEELGRKVCIEGASEEVLSALGIPIEWAQRCEDSFHLGHNQTRSDLENRLEWHFKEQTFKNFENKIKQLGSYGGGNHFGECEEVELVHDSELREIANTFGLLDQHIAFLSHCGSRGLGNILAQKQFKLLQQHFQSSNIKFPAEDPQLVYALLGTPQANDYIDDMSIGANFATVNHMLINALVLEAFQEVLPETKGHLIYFISHNIARQEWYQDKMQWIHRKGATRAFPAGHPSLQNTPFAATGHPILLPGNPRDGSVVMVAQANAKISAYSVNHGAGRRLGRKAASRQLNQKEIDLELNELDILSNCRQYPIDEAPDAYKDFKEVLNSVETAGLAKTVCRLKAKFVIKDGGAADD